MRAVIAAARRDATDGSAAETDAAEAVVSARLVFVLQQVRACASRRAAIARAGMMVAVEAAASARWEAFVRLTVVANARRAAAQPGRPATRALVACPTAWLPHAIRETAAAASPTDAVACSR